MSHQDQATEDRFFSDEPEFIKAYTFDRAAMTQFEIDLEKSKQCASLAANFGLTLPCYCYAMSLAKDNVQDKVNATHVAITRDGIKYVVDFHKTGMRCDCLDQGKVSKTVAFSKITDADIEEPAGKSGPCLCCMVDNVLTSVNVDTASSGGPRGHELSIDGLSDPNQFKADVWSMIRGDGVNGFTSNTAGRQVNAVPAMERGGKSVMERMDELEKMKAKGYVNENEYDAKRKDILSSA
ncbi:hypothetical protein TrST_g6359 [Triparma strigata]|uniref:SHOCT domain-containing protein n=1 Tax=Triparma strigata TaxID=1606541 RepID=A0A9W7A5I8_9STRA|nr:hypothetical protein TrST_g6359 [Triparma strigata]